MMEEKTPAAFVALLEKYGAMMSIENVCEVLRINRTDVQYVINRKRLLTPLGSPKTNSVKWFSTHTLSTLIENDSWLDKVRRAVQQGSAERSK